ncbi:MAG: ABC transporter ATP-binding protein [Thermoplasmatota archaeon]
MTTREPAPIVLQDLRKSFGAVQAVDGLSLTVERGEIYGLLGPNGCGKTTAIRILMGLSSLTSGKAWLLGKPVPPGPAQRAQVGYMPQETALYGELTIMENLDTMRRIYGMGVEDFRMQAKRLLEWVDLTYRRDSVVQELSGGMRRRASLVAAMLHQPRLLLLDEPTVGVDPALRKTFWEFFHSLQKEGVTVVITTHYMDEAKNCSRVGLMHRGHLIAEGAPAELVASAGASDLEEAFLRLSQEAT